MEEEEAEEGGLREEEDCSGDMVSVIIIMDLVIAIMDPDITIMVTVLVLLSLEEL